jgi:DNA polymerase epsilon subunit 1
MLAVADAHLARCLRDAGHLLWVADPGLPDVASRGDDDAEEDLLLSDTAPLEVPPASGRFSSCLQSAIFPVN